MNSARVAVIMPCYNAEKYIVQTMESVLAQSYGSYRVIAGNDGSTDRTADILQNYADRTMIVSHPDHGNHGQGATYNLCLNHSDAEYIAFIDGDDLWHPDKTLRQVQVLDDHPEVGLVYTNGNVIDSENRLLHSFFDRNHRETNETFRILLDCYIRTPSTVMVRSRVLQNAGAFMEGAVPDHDMWIRIKELSDFFYINDDLFSYRVHSEQFSQVSRERMWRNSLETLNRAMSRYPYPRRIRSKRLAVIHYRLGQSCLQSNKAVLAAYHFSCAFVYDPSRALRVLKQNMAHHENR